LTEREKRYLIFVMNQKENPTGDVNHQPGSLIYLAKRNARQMHQVQLRILRTPLPEIKLQP
jgi:hypothetical protein